MTNKTLIFALLVAIVVSTATMTTCEVGAWNDPLFPQWWCANWVYAEDCYNSIPESFFDPSTNFYKSNPWP